MKITFKPFRRSVAERAKALGVTYYHVVAANQDGSQGRLLGIVRKDTRSGAPVWTADGMPFAAQVKALPSTRTRKEAAAILVEAHRNSLLARVGTR